MWGDGLLGGGDGESNGTGEHEMEAGLNRDISPGVIIVCLVMVKFMSGATYRFEGLGLSFFFLGCPISSSGLKYLTTD